MNEIQLNIDSTHETTKTNIHSNNLRTSLESNHKLADNTFTFVEVHNLGVSNELGKAHHDDSLQLSVNNNIPDSATLSSTVDSDSSSINTTMVESNHNDA
jgi:hypothetical protein